ncbi:MAG: DUF768 domain-containing protein [Mesorhizobium sp.]|nr:MAG: DUF768 domain-containing protein [Mesorhizobium sp.]
MSARALKFLDRWMADHLPNVGTDDPEATADLVLELLATAGRQGIAPKEIYEEVDSLFSPSERSDATPWGRLGRLTWRRCLRRDLHHF